MHENRRKEVRHNIVITVQIKFGTSLSLQACENLSGGGAFFRHAIPFKVGTTVDVDFTLPGERRAIRCKGEVANVPQPGGYGMGVRFLGLSLDEHQRITQFAEQFATAEETLDHAVEGVEDTAATAPEVTPEAAPEAAPVVGTVPAEVMAAAVAAAPEVPPVVIEVPVLVPVPVPVSTPAAAEAVASPAEPAKIAPAAPDAAPAAVPQAGLEESR